MRFVDGVNILEPMTVKVSLKNSKDSSSYKEFNFNIPEKTRYILSQRLAKDTKTNELYLGDFSTFSQSFTLTANLGKEINLDVFRAKVNFESTNGTVKVNVNTSLACNSDK